MAPKQLSADCQLDSDFCPGGVKVNLLQHTKGKKVILMGLPGAFTPT